MTYSTGSMTLNEPGGNDGRSGSGGRTAGEEMRNLREFGRFAGGQLAFRLQVAPDGPDAPQRRASFGGAGAAGFHQRATELVLGGGDFQADVVVLRILGSGHAVQGERLA